MAGFFSQPPGFRFAPTARQILLCYLPEKITGHFPHDAAIPTLDLFSPLAPPPWLLHPAAACAATSSSSDCCATPTYLTDWFYCFALVTPRGSGFCRDTGVGNWLANGRDRKIERGGHILGHMTALSFRVPDGSPKGRNTGWVLNEFRLHREKAAPKAETLVFCRIRCSRPLVWKEAMGMMGPEEEEEEEHPHHPCKRQRSDPNLISGAAATMNPGALPSITPDAGGEYGGYGAMQLPLLEGKPETTTTWTAPDISSGPEGVVSSSSCSATGAAGLPCPPAVSNEDDILEGINAEGLDCRESCRLGGEQEGYSYDCPTESAAAPPCASPSSADDHEDEEVWRLIRELGTMIDDDTSSLGL